MHNALDMCMLILIVIAFLVGGLPLAIVAGIGCLLVSLIGVL